MKRRDFLKTAAVASVALHELASSPPAKDEVPKRPYRDGIDLSVIGFGGIVVVGLEQGVADRTVAESVDRGINYFDVAPTYGKGEAEEKLGIALKPYRKNAFLACKTQMRDAEGAQKELEHSLKMLHTDHFDLYQFHAVRSMEDVEKILAPGGAAETFLKAKEAGKVRYIGFSAHHEEAALALLDRFDEIDSVLYPINYVCYAEGGFGPGVMQKAKEKGVARLALKAMAKARRQRGEKRPEAHPKCWYHPLTDPERIQLGLRFTLSEDVTAAIPPGDETLYKIALDMASGLKPITAEERRQLLASAEGLSPLFKA